MSRDWTECPPPDLGRAEGDPLIWTPSAVRNELARVRQTLDTVNLEVSDSAKSGKVTTAEWELWRTFYVVNHKRLDDASAYTGSSVDTARQMEKQAIKWRDLSKGRGGKTIGPKDLAPKTEESFGLSFTTKALIAGGAVLLVVAIVKS